MKTRPRSDFDIALELTRDRIAKLEFRLGAFSPGDELPYEIERMIAEANGKLRLAYAALKPYCARPAPDAARSQARATFWLSARDKLLQLMKAAPVAKRSRT